MVPESYQDDTDDDGDDDHYEENETDDEDSSQMDDDPSDHDNDGLSLAGLSVCDSIKKCLDFEDSEDEDDN